LTADLGFGENYASDVKIQGCKWGWQAQEDGVQTIYLCTVAHYRALTLNPRVVAFCRASISQFDLVHLYGLYDLLGPAVSRHSLGDSHALWPFAGPFSVMFA
jgi:hypothetical protein